MKVINLGFGRTVSIVRGSATMKPAIASLGSPPNERTSFGERKHMTLCSWAGPSGMGGAFDFFRPNGQIDISQSLKVTVSVTIPGAWRASSFLLIEAQHITKAMSFVS